jgi:uncharacterized protein (TIGR02646 family)
LIRIAKSAAEPPILADGAALVEAHEAARQADPTAGANRKNAFKFEKKIYGSASVKRALRKAQHDKCCYCEGSFAAQSSGDVEHFRPKTCFQQAKGAPIEYPGYYWLAYSWSNLYYACEICNRMGKRSLFPLTDPSQRNRSGNDNHQEAADILDPGGADDPRDHIRFNGAAVEGITVQGRKTIEALGLHRGDLTTARLQHLKLLGALKDVVVLSPEETVIGRRAREMLQQVLCSNAIYSSMAQDFLRP